MQKTEKPKPAKNTLPRPKRVFMCPADLRLFFGSLIRSQSGIMRHWQAMRDALDKKGRQRITIQEFAQYEGIDLALVIETINASEPD